MNPPFGGAVDGRSRDGAQLGEVGDGVVTGLVHAPEFGLLLGREFRLPAAQSPLGPGYRHPLPCPHAQQMNFDYVDNCPTSRPEDVALSGCRPTEYVAHSARAVVDFSTVSCAVTLFAWFERGGKQLRR